MTTDGKSPSAGGASHERGYEAPRRSGRHPAFDTSMAHQSRIYDYMLGGKDNFAADRAAGDAIIEADPGLVRTARANRAFLGRAVRFLASEAGIGQFLDIGTGIPAAGSTHEVAQEAAPGSRVVYVDHDPVVLAHARALLTGGPAGAVAYLDADLRDTGTILARAARTLDFSQPVAVLLLLILHVIGDADDPYQIVTRLMDAMPAGSYLAISHGASDIKPERMAELAERINQVSYQQFSSRSRAEVERFFAGLELVEPGVVQVQQWRPGIMPPGAMPVWAGVARKP